MISWRKRQERADTLLSKRLVTRSLCGRYRIEDFVTSDGQAYCLAITGNTILSRHYGSRVKRRALAKAACESHQRKQGGSNDRHPDRPRTGHRTRVVRQGRVARREALD